MDNRDSESKDLLGVGNSLDDRLEWLTEEGGDLLFYLVVYSFIWVDISMGHAKIDFYKSFCIVCFGAEFGLRWSLQASNDLCPSECVAELKLTSWVKSQWVNPCCAELLYGTLSSYLGLSESHRYLKPMVLVICASFERVQADNLDLTCWSLISHWLWNWRVICFSLTLWA